MNEDRSAVLFFSFSFSFFPYFSAPRPFFLRFSLLLFNIFVLFPFFFLFHSAIVGELNEEMDSQLDLSAIVAEPLKAVVH